MRKNPKILVIGANGQLGSCIKKIAGNYDSDYEFLFTDSAQLDITDVDAVDSFFYDERPAFCINASAYTAVDLAETEKDRAFAVNADGVGNIAKACHEYRCILIHVSTDYVFSGDTEIPYSEDNFTEPTGVYGLSKRTGEEMALDLNPKTIIIRTSWLYSEFKKNFVKTMLHLFAIKEEIGVVADQFGQPTNANDLAEAIMSIIENPAKKFGIFHFSNFPETSWHGFASKIAELSGSQIKINELSTAQYPTPAKRPVRSTMCLDKIEEEYGIEPKNWENSLKDCLNTLKTADHS